MGWKIKEKELTEEEAIELAKKELAPCWFNLPPQLAGIQTPQGFTVIPLDPQFSKKSWLMFFIDPTEFSGQTCLVYAHEWFKRYQYHALLPLFVIHCPYEFWKNRETVSQYLEAEKLHSTAVMDRDQNIGKAFGAVVPPKVLLLNLGRVQFESTGSDWLKNTEVRIQSFLRAKDPGLSMFIPFEPKKIALLQDVRRVEFGFNPKSGHGAVFEKAGFVSISEGLRAARFSTVRPTQLAADQVFLGGEWRQDAEKIFTSDPSASLIFTSTGTAISMIAQSLAQPAGLNSSVTIELDGSPVYDAVSGENLIFEESGSSVVRVRHPHIYHLLKNLPANREVTFRFPHAKTLPVGLYGLRFGG